MWWLMVFPILAAGIVRWRIYWLHERGNKEIVNKLADRARRSVGRRRIHKYTLAG